MCKHGSRFFVGYKLIATCKKSERQRDREINGQTEVYISLNHHTTRRSNKRERETIIVAEDCFYASTGSIASNPIIFGMKHFDTEVRAFLSSSPELKFTYNC